jgi:hypothetical protein
MTHPVDAMRDEAAEAVAAMKAAAVKARHLHARAELARHMRTTAAKLAARPTEAAAAAIAAEWMKAWSLDASAYAAIAGEVAAFTRAFCLDARGATPTTQASIRQAFAGLEDAFRSIGTTLSDEMAFRSECAHGWWGSVTPPPASGGQPFWSAGAKPHCG